MGLTITPDINIYNADGKLANNRVVDLNGKFLKFQENAIDWFNIDPATGENIYRSYNTTGLGNNSHLRILTEATEAQFDLDANFNNGVNQVFIQGITDATTATIDYTADTHTFNGEVVLDDLAGNGAGVVAVDNAGLLSWSAAGGGSFDYTQVLFAQVFS